MTDSPGHRTADYDYPLPEDRIAQTPATPREDARLLVLDRGRPPGRDRTDARVSELGRWLRPGDLLVLNDTRVRPARLFGTRAATGGRCEVLLLEERAGSWELLLRTRGHPAPGERLALCGGRIEVLLESRGERGAWTGRVRPSGPELAALLEAEGRVPLPPYIRREREGDPRDALDRERYQTVWASRPGAAAAPTAGLHLGRDHLERLQAAGVDHVAVTLHVGLGTFRPVEVEDYRDHPMHEEAWEIGEAARAAILERRAAGGRIVPVGTTAVRVLESAATPEGDLAAGVGRTRLFIHPPWRFRFVDALLTNFHAPRSTLLLLVAALAGRERMLAAYAHAVAGGYRFLSYGDAMFIHGDRHDGPV